MENKTPTFGNGKICYIEVPAADLDASTSFYEEVFGWQIRTREEATASFDDSVTEVSGLFVTGRPPHTNTNFLVHIMVYDMDKTLAAVVAHGGKVVQPVGMDLPEITARISDPTGNIFGLYQHHRSV